MLFLRAQRWDGLSIPCGVDALSCLVTPDQALTRAYQALTVAQALSHPLSVAWALFCAAVLHRYRQEWHATQEQAEALISLLNPAGATALGGAGEVLRGWAVTGQGEREAEIEPMRQSLATWRAMGAELEPGRIFLPCWPRRVDA